LGNEDDREVDYTLGADGRGYKLSVMKSKRPDPLIWISDEEKAISE